MESADENADFFTRPAPAHQNAPFRGLRRNEVHGAKQNERHVGGRRRGGEPAVSCRAVCVLGKAGGLFQHPDRAEVAEALDAFAGWHPTVRSIIGAVDETYKWALFDRDPLSRWTRGRTTLLGDAAHPMLPFMAQGACQAIEDGAALAACLRAGGDVPAALLRYEQIRKPRATRLQELSRNNKIRFHLHDGPEQQRRDAELVARGDRTFPVIGWLYAHDAAALDPAA